MSDKKSKKRNHKHKHKKKKGKKFDPLVALTEEQREAFHAFRQRLGLTSSADESTDDIEWDDEQREWLSDMCLCRYLRARSYDVDKAEEMINGTLEWRAGYKPGHIDPKDIYTEAEPGKMYVSKKKDAQGRPIIYMKPRRDNSYERDIKLKYLVYIVEEAIAYMDESKGVEKTLIVVDYSGTGIRQSSPAIIRVSLDCLHVLQNHYPERLGVAFFVHPPYLFNMFWKCITPFADPVTLLKMQFVNGKKEFSKMLEHVDADCLEVPYGGNYDYDFDMEEWKKEHALVDYSP